MTTPRPAALEEILSPVADAILAMAPTSGVTREQILDMLYAPYMKATLTMTLTVLDAAADMIGDEFSGETAREIERRVRTFMTGSGLDAEES